MKKRPEVYLADMLQYGRRIIRYTGSGRADFLANPMVQDAVIRNFEVVGEAASRVPQDLRATNPQIPWRSVIGFRNVLIHGYSGVSLEEVWEIVQNTLPELLQALESLLRERGIDPDRVPE